MTRRQPNKTYGAVSEQICAAYYSYIGFAISKPITDDSAYDLVVDDDRSIKRIQCKSTLGLWNKYGHPEMVMTPSRKKHAYLISDFDILWILTSRGIYIIPVEDLPSRNGELSSFTLSPKYNAFLIDFPIELHANPSYTRISRKMSKIEMDRIISLANLGASKRAIAMIMGMRYEHILNFLKTKRLGQTQAIVITDEIKREVIKMYLKCVPIPVIAEIFCAGHSAINKIVQKYLAGLPNHERPKLSSAQRTRIYKMRQNGLSSLEIARRLGLTFEESDFTSTSGR